MKNNIPTSIQDKINKDLYRDPNHPICIVKNKVLEYFDGMTSIEIDNPYVPIEYNFDRLRVPTNHPSRSITDTYYKDNETCLRTHMTCYLYPLAKTDKGHSQLKYITTGDVYRKDAIDANHYPVFHQMDGFYIVDPGTDVKEHLRSKLKGLLTHLFGPEVKYKFLEDSEYEEVYFPFTIDSLEVSVTLTDSNGKEFQLEILGAGTVHPDIMKDLGLPDHQAWAFGLGLERLAMVMFDIPDIRLFWSTDNRFTSQFTSGKVNKFAPFSKYESCYKDISFYINDQFNYNDLCSLARDEDKDNLIESISLFDTFENKGHQSHCYRITYRAMDKTLKNSEINQIQNSLRKRIETELGVKIR